MTISFINIYTNGYGFIDKKFTEIICQILEIKL